ncbi:PulJ/GspJ family protein [Acetivibrio clariflavus]|uniref:Prepilin-type N-terminal cleavage/methylation domain-containing protein n=1 Tax=Acetivibrio clariflavus (strain DSM 19732 / NBRC 101661 / EBR45) TaxID=720554 RepID=G8M0K0_ACECE|nr:type II secretion system protein [Acetivibrio clariflavus]AEV68045.1 prepilin-type N-terminal cleavage/methylation domain-containing protein [Acetivibrio clariflavus DSM 19732]
MLIKNKKGISLTEVLVALALVGIVSPLIFTIFVFGLEDYSTTTKYLNQQYSVMEVIRYIRQDIEAAKKVTYLYTEEAEGPEIKEIIFEFPNGDLRMWKFEALGDDGDSFKGLRLKSVPKGKYTLDDEKYEITDSSIEYQNIIDKLDLSQSGFEIKSESATPSKLILTIRPERLNKTRYRGRNVNENIITEFSVRYKINEKLLIE